MLRNRRRNPCNIYLLKRICSYLSREELAVMITGDRIHIGCSDSRNQIGRSGPEVAKHTPTLPDVRHIRAAWAPPVHALQEYGELGFSAVHHKSQHSSSRISKYNIYILFFHRFD